MYNVINQTSQLTGKAYKDSDYTIVITMMQWQRIIIVQKLTFVVELCLPVVRHRSSALMLMYQNSPLWEL